MTLVGSYQASHSFGLFIFFACVVYVCPARVFVVHTCVYVIYY